LLRKKAERVQRENRQRGKKRHWNPISSDQRSTKGKCETKKNRKGEKTEGGKGEHTHVFGGSERQRRASFFEKEKTAQWIERAPRKKPEYLRGGKKLIATSSERGRGTKSIKNKPVSFSGGKKVSHQCVR